LLEGEVGYYMGSVLNLVQCYVGRKKKTH
jgi:hypothetical protein